MARTVGYFQNCCPSIDAKSVNHNLLNIKRNETTSYTFRFLDQSLMRTYGFGFQLIRFFRCCISLSYNLKNFCQNLNLAQLFWLSEVQTKIDRYQALLDFHSCCCYTILTYFWFILQIGKAIYPSWEQENLFRVVVLNVICDSKYDAKRGKGVSD